jgi:hypothetical protein
MFVVSSVRVCASAGGGLASSTPLPSTTTTSERRNHPRTAQPTRPVTPTATNRVAR